MKNSNSGKKHGIGKILLIIIFALTFVSFIGIVCFAMTVKKQMDVNEKKKKKEKDTQEAYYETFTEEEIRYEKGVSYVDSRLLLIAEEGVSYSEMEEIIQSVEGEVIGYIPLTGDYQIQFQKKSYEELESLIEELEEMDEIYEVTLETVSEVDTDAFNYMQDPWIASEYPEDTSGQTWDIFSPDGANWWAESILMPKVWEMDIETESINVGLIDSYFDSGNEDLAEPFATGEIIGQDGLDISALYEETVKQEQENQKAIQGCSSGSIAHGTVDAGIIGAVNNEFGICGISQNVNLFGVSLYGNSENWNRLSLMGMKYGIASLLEQNVKVINISMGATLQLFAAQQEASGKDKRTTAAIDDLKQTSQVMEVFLKRCLKKHDFLIVKSAGNQSGTWFVQEEVGEEYPYGYRLAEEKDPKKIRIQNPCDAKYDYYAAIKDKEVAEHIVIVGAADLIKEEDGSQNHPGIAFFSCTGERVDLYAPGGCIVENGKRTDIQILSDYPANSTGYMQGTSQATPMVAGTAALIWGVNPEFTAGQVREILHSSARVITDGETSFRFLNTYGAVQKAQVTEPKGTKKDDDTALLLGYAYTTPENDNEIETVEAEITVIRKSDGKEQKVELDKDDTFSVFLENGEYTIKAKSDGYEETSQDITISAGQTNFVSILMKGDKLVVPIQEQIMETEEDWMDFLTSGDYKNYISEEWKTSVLKYAVYDLNKDGNLELMIETTSDAPFYYSWLFTLKGDQIILAYEGYGYGSFRYSPDYNAILMPPETKPMVDAAATAFYELTGSEMVSKFVITQTGKGIQYLEGTESKFISSEEKEKYFSGIVNFEWKPIPANQKLVSDKTDLKIYLGTDIYAFLKLFNDMEDAGNTDGHIEYTNGSIIVSQSPWEEGIQFLSIESPCNYSIYGIEYGMAVENAISLIQENVAQTHENQMYYKSYEMKNGNILSFHAEDGQIIDSVHVFWKNE